jgi:hypothetical protein
MDTDGKPDEMAPARTFTLQQANSGETPLSMSALRAQIKAFSPSRMKTFFNGFSSEELVVMRELIDGVHRELAELRGE